MKRIGQLVFLGAVVLALALYWITAPDGLPWNGSTHLALAYLCKIVRLPAMPHPVWGCYVQVFGGAIALSAFMAALAAGLLAVLVNRYFGWRFAASVALVWTFLPGVWNRAITGERGVCLAAMCVVAAWAANGVLLRVLKKAHDARMAAKKTSGGLIEAALPSAEAMKKRERVNRIAGWVALGVSGLFAVVSLTLHDYRYGEAASIYAKGVVDEAGERIVVLNGACDDQVVREVEKRGGGGQRRVSSSDAIGTIASTKESGRHCPPPPHLSTLSLRNDDAYRARLLAWVKSAFPGETNLWVAAQVSAEAFAEVAVKAHPERFYRMDGKDSTIGQWEKRWEAFKPYLESSDPFVSVGRRMFGYEGNSIANAMLESKLEVESSTSTLNFDSSLAAWRLYKRIYTEVDPGNISALVNMSEMIRRGYAASGDEQKKVQEALEKFFKDASNRQHAREIVRAAGPIRADPALVEKMAAEAKTRIAAKIAAGEKVEYAPEVLSLIEWSNEMVRLMDKGELVQAGRIARTILSNPQWQGFVPANGVMGSVAAQEGDFVSSEAFFKVATDTTNAVPAVVLNDYADTLFNLGKLDEAERQSRRAVKASEESFWVARLTLAEVLEKKGERVNGEGVNGEGEIRELLKSVLKHAPANVRERIRKEHRGYVR